MNPVFFLIPLLLIISIPTAFGEIVETKGQNYDLVENFIIGEANWQSHPERIMNGSWQNYVLTTNDQKVMFHSNAVGGLIFDKDSCSYSIKDNGYNGDTIIPSVSAIATYLKDGTWQHLPINDQACTVSTIPYNDGVVLTATKVITENITEPVFITYTGTTENFYGNGTNNAFTLIQSSNGTNTGYFNGEVIITEGAVVEQFTQEIRMDINSGFKETFKVWHDGSEELGISQTVHTGEEIVIGETTIPIAQYSGQSFDRDFIVTNEAEILQLTDELNYDFDEGINSLSNVNIIFEDSKYKVNLDYSSGGFVGYLEIDPTFTPTSSTFKKTLQSGSQTGVACSVTGDAMTDSYSNAIQSATSSSNGQCRSYVYEWDISSVPSTYNVVSDGEISYSISALYGNNKDLDYKAYTSTQPSTLSGASGAGTILSHVSSSTTYNTVTPVTGTNTIDLGTNANTDIASQISSGWFSTVVEYAGDRDSTYSYSGTMSHATLSFTYDIAIAPNAPTNLSTITGIPIELDWDAVPTSGNGGSPITGYKVFRTLNEFALTELPDNSGTDSQITFTDNELLLHGVDVTSNYGIPPANPDADFSSSDGWVSSRTSHASIGSGVLSFSTITDGTNTSIVYDLGSPAEDTWVLRGKMSVPSQGHNGVGYGQGVNFGLSDKDSATGSTGLQDFIGVKYLHDNIDRPLGGVWADDQGLEANYGAYGNQFGGNIGANTVMYFEVIRESATTYKINHYSDASYSSLVSSLSTATISTEPTDLQYVVIRQFRDNQSQGGGETLTIDDVSFHNGVTSTTDSITYYTNSISDSSTNNVPVTASSTAFVTGTIGNAISNPNLSYTHSTLPSGTNDFSVGGWVGFNSITGTTPLVDDDFSSYTTQSSADAVWNPNGLNDDVNISNDNLEFTSSGTGNYIDLNNAVLDNDWMLQFKLSMTSKLNGIVFMVQDNTSTTISTPRDGIGLRQTDTTNYYDFEGSNNVGGNAGQYDARFSTASPALDTKWIKIIRTSSTEGIIEIYSDEYVTLIESETVTIANISNLRYFVVSSGGSAFTVDDVKFYDVASPIYGTPPTDTKLLGINDVTFNVGTTSASVREYSETTTTTYPNWDTLVGSGLSFNSATGMITKTAGAGWNGLLLDSSGVSASTGGLKVGWEHVDTGWGGYTVGFRSTTTQSITDWDYWLYCGSTSCQHYYDGYNYGNTDQMPTGYSYNYITGIATGDTIHLELDSNGEVNTYHNDVLKGTFGGANAPANTGTGTYYVYTLAYPSGTYGSPSSSSTTITDNTVISATGLTDNTSTPHHYAFTRDANSWKVFQDGSQVGTTVIDTTSLGANSVRDSSLDGTNSGATTGVTGKVGNAWDFDGSNDGITTSWNTGFDGGSPFSVSMWINPDVANSGAIVFDRDVSGGDGWETRFTGNDVQVNFEEGSNYLACDTTAITLNVWSHVVLVYDGTVGNFDCNAITFYVDGSSVTVNHAADVGTMGSWDTSANFGLGDWHTVEYDGGLDEVAVYDKVLSSSEVSALYNSGSGDSTPSTTNLIAHYNFEQTGSTLENQVTIDSQYTTTLDGTLDEFFINSDALTGTEIDTIYERGALPTLIASPTLSEYDDNTVSGGNVYFFTVAAINAIGESPLITPMVSGLAGTPPGVPTGVSTTIPTPNSTPLDVTVSWSSPTNVGSGTLTGFEVYRDGVLQTTTGLVTSYVDTVPNSGTFVYSLKSVSNHGTSILSSTSSITTATIPVTPVAPTGLIAAPNTTPLDVTVSWVAPGDGGSSITNYDLYRSVSSGSGFAVVQSAITGLTHIDTVPSAGTWYYTIVANNLVGATPQSPELTIATPNVPSAISDLAASTVSDTAINLTWGIPSNGGSNIIDYAVYRDGSSIGTVTTPGFSDIGLTQQTSYTYTVYARNNVGTSLISNSIAQSTHGVPAVVVSFLAAPASLTQIDLTWTAPNDYNSAITSYVIERESPIGGGFAPLITLGSVTSYSDPGLASVQEYNYRIKAVNFYGNGPTVSASTITLPAAPTNVLVTPSSSASELLITWDEPLLTTGIVGYQIVREDGVGTGFSPVTIAFGTNHTDTGLTTNIYYNYKIASAATQGNSAYSDTYSQTTYHLPNGVETLTATSGALIDAALTWSPPTVPYGYITGYEIYQSTTGTPNVLIDSVTATTYTATDLDPTITYYWLVAPVTIHGSNSTSNIVNATATSAIVIGSITLSSEVNTDTVPIFFHEIRNVNSTALTVTYGSTTNLQCDFEYKFARNTVTHGSLAQTYVSNVQASHTFTFNNSANEIISVHCYDQDTNPGGIITNDTTDGKFQINFATQPIVTQVNEFQKGAFGISGGFGAFDLMTMFVVILSMVGFNRKNPAVGVGIMVAFIGAMGYFGIIEVPTIMMGAIAVVVILAIGTARRKLG